VAGCQCDVGLFSSGQCGTHVAGGGEVRAGVMTVAERWMVVGGGVRPWTGLGSLCGRSRLPAPSLPTQRVGWPASAM